MDELVAHARAGDCRALHRALRAMNDLVYPVALCMVAPPCEAVHVTQAILIRLVTMLGSCPCDGGARAWVYRCATDYLLATRELSVTLDDCCDIERICASAGLRAPDALADELHALITCGG